MLRYEKYKDSGIDWLGEIPEHWEIKRLGSWFEERKIKVSDKEFAPLSVTKNGIVPQLDSAAKSNDGDNRKLVVKGDFVINSRSDRKGSSGLSTFDGSTSLINIVLKPINICGAFSNYLLKSNWFIEEFYRNGHGIVADLWTTRFDEMKFIYLAMPTQHEQKAIFEFLDHKCTKIDTAVGLKQQQIEKLKELRQITIHNAVTKGIRNVEGQGGTVPIKDSGIEWIGEIPAHWEVKRLKNVLHERNVRSMDGQETLFMMSQSYGLVVRSEYHKKEQVSKTNEGNKLVYPDDLVFNKLKPHLGVFYKNRTNIIGSVSPDYAVYFSKNLHDIVYLEYLFKTHHYISQFKIKSNGIVEGLIRLYTADLFSIHIAIPTKEEQAEIVAYLDKQTSKIDTAISQKQEQIAKLKEYKQSLINDVVTGKIKVV